MADGTEGLYDIDWDKSEDAFASQSDLENYLGTRDVMVGYTSNVDAAVGSVIKYSLDSDDVLTIERVMRGNEMDPTSHDIITVDSDSRGRVYVNNPNHNYVESKLAESYENGDGTLVVNNWVDASTSFSTEDHEYAIDRNTIAFYYEDADNYGVAIGWQNMGDLDLTEGDVYVQVWPAERKTNTHSWEPTDLVEVALFDTNPLDPMEDWLFVLSRNAFTSDDVMELNVVFEDGTADVITIDFKEWFDDNAAAYQCAYKFSVDKDGTYKLDTGDDNNNGVIDAGTETFAGKAASHNAVLLKNGTLDIGGSVYPTITDDSAIWDVTDMDDATEDAVPGTFSNVAKNAVVIYSDHNKSVVTAWVWDIDPDEITYGLTMNPGSAYGWNYRLNSGSVNTVNAVSTTVQMKTSDELTLIPYTDGTNTYPITNVTGTGCRITNNGDGTWTVTRVSEDASITITVGAGVVTPVVTIDLSSTYELKVNNAPVDQLKAEIERVLTAAGYADAKASYDANAAAGSSPWTVTTDGITWKVTVTP